MNLLSIIKNLIQDIINESENCSIKASPLCKPKLGKPDNSMVTVRSELEGFPPLFDSQATEPFIMLNCDQDSKMSSTDWKGNTTVRDIKENTTNQNNYWKPENKKRSPDILDSQLYYKEAESTRNSDIEDYQEMRSENYNKLENMFKKEDEDKSLFEQQLTCLHVQERRWRQVNCCSKSAWKWWKQEKCEKI